MTTAQIQQQLNFTTPTLANGNVNPAWDLTNIWVVYNGFTSPLLRSFMTPLTVTASNAAKTYDGLAYAGGNGVSYSSVPNANLLGTLSYSGSSQGAINVGGYVIAPTGLYSSQQGYLINTVNGALTVNAAPLNVTANAFTKTYNGLAYSGGNGVIYTGFVNGETNAVLGGALAYTGNSQGAINVGGYTITPGGLTAGNYTLSYANGALTVNPVAPLAGFNVLAAQISTQVAPLSPSSTITVSQSSATAAGGDAFLPKADEKDKTKTNIGVKGPTLFIVEGGLRLPDNMFNAE